MEPAVKHVPLAEADRGEQSPMGCAPVATGAPGPSALSGVSGPRSGPVDVPLLAAHTPGFWNTGEKTVNSEVSAAADVAGVVCGAPGAQQQNQEGPRPRCSSRQLPAQRG